MAVKSCKHAGLPAWTAAGEQWEEWTLHVQAVLTEGSQQHPPTADPLHSVESQVLGQRGGEGVVRTQNETVGSDEWLGLPSEGQGSGCGLQDPEALVRSRGLLPPLHSSVRPLPKPSISRQESHQKHAL